MEIMGKFFSLPVPLSPHTVLRISRFHTDFLNTLCETKQLGVISCEALDRLVMPSHVLIFLTSLLYSPFPIFPQAYLSGISLPQEFKPYFGLILHTYNNTEYEFTYIRNIYM